MKRINIISMLVLISVMCTFVSAENTTLNHSKENEESFVLTNLEVEVGSKTDKNLENKNDYKIDYKTYAEDVITFTAIIKNELSDKEMKARMEVTIEKIDDNRDLNDRTSKETIRENKEEKLELEFEIPKRVDGGNYDVLILITIQEEDGENYEIEKRFKLEVDKERHDLKLDAVFLLKNNLDCGEKANLLIKAVNYGEEREKEIKIIVTNNLMNLNFERFNDGRIALNTGTDKDASYEFNVPIETEGLNGTYKLAVKLFKNEDELEDVELINLNVKCQFQKIIYNNKEESEEDLDKLVEELLKEKPEQVQKEIEPVEEVKKEKSPKIGIFTKLFSLILLIF